MAQMVMRPVKSSNVAVGGYDPYRHALRIRFKDGKTYEYHDVPHETADAYEAAESKGSFIAQHLR